MRDELKMEGKLKELAARFLYLLVLPLLRRHPVIFPGCHWMPRIWSVRVHLEIEP